MPTMGDARPFQSNIELRGERPLNMMDTQPGFDRVRDLLLRIERGVGL